MFRSMFSSLAAFMSHTLLNNSITEVRLMKEMH